MRAWLRRPIGIWTAATGALILLDLALNVVTGLWRQAYEVAGLPAYETAQRALDVAVYAHAPGYQPMDAIAPMQAFDLGAALMQTATHGVVGGCLLGLVVLLAAYGQRVLAAVGVLVTTASVGLMAGPLGTLVVAIPSGRPEAVRDVAGLHPPITLLASRVSDAYPYALQPTWWAWTCAAVVGAIALVAMLAVERGPAGAPARVGGAVTAYAVPVTLVVAALVHATTEIDPGHNSTDLAHQLMWWVTAVVAGLCVAAGTVGSWRPTLALSLGWAAAYWMLLLAYGYDGGTPRGWGHDSDWGDFPVYASAASSALVVAAPLVGFAAARVRDAVRRHHTQSASPLPA
jgi:hypothetical protein